MKGIDTNGHDDKFFMSWRGKRVSSPMVSVQLNSFGEKQSAIPKKGQELVRHL